MTVAKGVERTAGLSVSVEYPTCVANCAKRCEYRLTWRLAAPVDAGANAATIRAAAHDG